MIRNMIRNIEALEENHGILTIDTNFLEHPGTCSFVFLGGETPFQSMNCMGCPADSFPAWTRCNWLVLAAKRSQQKATGVHQYILLNIHTQLGQEIDIEFQISFQRGICLLN